MSFCQDLGYKHSVTLQNQTFNGERGVTVSRGQKNFGNIVGGFPVEPGD